MDRGKLREIIKEGQMVVRTSLQVAMDTFDTAVRLMARAIKMMMALWLPAYMQGTGYSKGPALQENGVIQSKN